MDKPTLNERTASTIRLASQSGMTKERAEAVEVEAKQHARYKNVPQTLVDRSRFLTEAEKSQVSEVWATLGGDSCWYSAWQCILKQVDGNGIPV